MNRRGKRGGGFRFWLSWKGESPMRNPYCGDPEIPLAERSDFRGPHHHYRERPVTETETQATVHPAAERPRKG